MKTQFISKYFVNLFIPNSIVDQNIEITGKTATTIMVPV